MVGLYLYVLCFVIFISIALFIFLKNEHNMQIRSPYLCLISGVIDFVLVATIGMHVRIENGLQCIVVLWAGNLLMNFLFTAELLRFWAIMLSSDRILRMRFKWTLQPLGMVKIAGFLTTIGVVSTVLMQFLTNIVLQENCIFFMPWWEFLPQIAVVASARVILTAIKKKIVTDVTNEEMMMFGVDFELNVSAVAGGGLLMVYLVYASLFSSQVNSEHKQKLRPEYVLVMFPAFNCLITLLVPCAKFLFQRKRRSKIYISLESGKPKQVRDILNNMKRAQEFREFAEEALCAESVDFCLEVLLYKKNASESQEGSSEISNLHSIFISIVKKFIVDYAPAEVAISSTCKRQILNFVEFSTFYSLCREQKCSIFDEAEKEVQFLLRANILDSFNSVSESKLNHSEHQTKASRNEDMTYGSGGEKTGEGVEGEDRA